MDDCKEPEFGPEESGPGVQPPAAYPKSTESHCHKSGFVLQWRSSGIGRPCLQPCYEKFFVGCVLRTN